MRSVAFACALGVAGASDFCCYWPAASDLTTCDACQDKAYDTDGQADCESDKDNTWCPDGPSPSPSPSPTPPGPQKDCPDGWTWAGWTVYEDIPRCCKDAPNYDPSAPTEECTDYSGCTAGGHWGGLAYADCPDGNDGRNCLEYLKSHNTIAFFCLHDEHLKYAGKNIRLLAPGKGGNKTITALVADTCGDDDCDGCCTAGAEARQACDVDMEFYTFIKHWGSEAIPDGGDPAMEQDYHICWQPIEGEAVSHTTVV